MPQIHGDLHFFVLCRGLHLAVIHSQPDVLDRLLYLMTKEPMLQAVIDEQNALYQVCFDQIGNVIKDVSQ